MFVVTVLENLNIEGGTPESASVFSFTAEAYFGDFRIEHLGEIKAM
jgi:hypothetical protein